MGFKFWVLADPTGYTCDFELYLGKRSTIQQTGLGLGYDTVMELTKAFQNQGYKVFFDNFYTSPALLSALKARKIFATGTLRSTRSGVPTDVKRLITAMKGKKVPRGTGYYIRECGSSDVYVCWKDNDCVTVLSNTYPGHSDGTARRASKDTAGSHSVVEVPLPSTIKYYNKFMGGVDKSDQYMSYHRILRQTKRYWKTIFYHLLEICTTNSYILYKWLCMIKNEKAPALRDFTDDLILAIIKKYPNTSSTAAVATDTSDFTIRHGSKPTDMRRRCAICKRTTISKCPDCPYTPALCHTVNRDCHGQWHTVQYNLSRSVWFHSQKPNIRNEEVLQPPAKRRGRPKGKKNRRVKPKF